MPKTFSAQINKGKFPHRNELYYEKLQRKFTVWNKVSLPSVDLIRRNLRQKGLQGEAKRELWKELNVKVFTQMLVNIYSSEIFKMIFMISTHLVARKEQEGENCMSLVGLLDDLTSSLKEEMIISEFIEGKIRSILEK